MRWWRQWSTWILLDIREDCLSLVFSDTNGVQHTNEVVWDETVARPPSKHTDAHHNQGTMSIAGCLEQGCLCCSNSHLSFNDSLDIQDFEIDKLVIGVVIGVAVNEDLLRFLSPSFLKKPSWWLKYEVKSSEGNKSADDLQHWWNPSRPVVVNAICAKSDPSCCGWSEIENWLEHGGHNHSPSRMCKLWYDNRS